MKFCAPDVCVGDKSFISLSAGCSLAAWFDFCLNVAVLLAEGRIWAWNWEKRTWEGGKGPVQLL